MKNFNEKILDEVKMKSNDIIEKFIDGKYDFDSLTSSQLSSLEDILESRNYNLDSKKIMEEISNKIRKGRGEKFFIDINENFIEKNEEILKYLEISNSEQEDKNSIFRYIFYLIKLNFKKENVIKNLKGSCKK